MRRLLILMSIVMLLVLGAECPSEPDPKPLDAEPRIAVSRVEGHAPFATRFELNLPRTDVLSTVWYFGDDQLSHELAPEHVYERIGTFDLRVLYETRDGFHVLGADDAITVTRSPFLPAAKYWSRKAGRVWAEAKPSVSFRGRIFVLAIDGLFTSIDGVVWGKEFIPFESESVTMARLPDALLFSGDFGLWTYDGQIFERVFAEPVQVDQYLNGVYFDYREHYTGGIGGKGPAIVPSIYSFNLHEWFVLDTPWRDNVGLTVIQYHGRIWAIKSNDLWVSEDGFQWENRRSFLEDTGLLAALFVAKDLVWVYVFDGDNELGRAWTTPDGIHWELVSNTIPPAKPQLDLHGNLVGYELSLFWKSGNAVDWESSSLDFLSGPLRFEENGAMVSFGDHLYYAPNWRSTDGIHWEKTEAFGGTVSRDAFVHDGHLWTARSIDTGVLSLFKTEDGSNWEEVDRFASRGVRHQYLSLNDRIFRFADEIAWSYDGKNWTVVSEDQPWSYLIDGVRSDLIDTQIHEFNQRLWFVGIRPQQTSLDVTLEFWSSIDGANWELSEPHALGDRSHMSIAQYQDTLYLVGGLDRAGKILNDIWRSDDGENWERIRENLPWQPRYLPILVSHNNEMLFFGGRFNMDPTSHLTRIIYRDVWAFSSADSE